MTSRSRSALAMTAVFAMSAQAAGQCERQWLPGEGIPGANGGIRAFAIWDPDGAGPLSPRVVVGGSFRQIGATRTRFIASWDGQTWHGFPAFMNAQPSAVAVTPDGDLIVAGGFSRISPFTMNGVVRWEGWPIETWISAGGAIEGDPRALAVLTDGSLVVAGALQAPGGPYYGVFRSNGSDWVPLGTWQEDLTALLALPDAGVVAARRTIAVWNGQSWDPLGEPMNGNVYALARLPNGDLIAAGQFTTAGTTPAAHIARWNGTAWEELGGGFNDTVATLYVDSQGDLIAGGSFTEAGGLPAFKLARWDGTAWAALDDGVHSGNIWALGETPSGTLLAGGLFTTDAPSAALNIAQWDGSNWTAIERGIDQPVRLLRPMPDGSILIGGDLQIAGGHQVSGLARFERGNISPFAPAIADNVWPTLSVSLLPGGELVVGGRLYNGTQSQIGNIAQWDGAAWSWLGGGLSAMVRATAVLPSGDLVAGGDFYGNSPAYIARWDGAAWQPMGNGTGGIVWSLLPMPSGDLIAGIASAGQQHAVKRWDGTAWTDVGQGVQGTTRTLTLLPSGELVAGGQFSTGTFAGEHIALWNGSSWQSLGGGMNNYVYSLEVTPEGDLLAGGEFTIAGGMPANRLARWDGHQWHAYGNGLDGYVRAINTLPNGDLVVGGGFHTAGGEVSAYLARWGCPERECYANCDYSTVAPILNIDDFTCYINEFAAAQSLPHAQQVAHYANCDGSTQAPALNVDDFTCFINAFAAGCR